MSQDFKEQFDEQSSFLRASFEAYDDGNEAEAKRLALALRIFLHDTRNSVSLLKHLGIKDRLPFIDTASPMPPPGAIVFFHGGLCTLHKVLGENAETRFAPKLDSESDQPPQCFEDWWETPIQNDQEGNSFSRRSFIRAVADQDGGAHIDAQLEVSYAALTRGNAMRITTNRERSDDGWETVLSGTVGGSPPKLEPPTLGEPIGNSIALASIRQIAHELSKTLAAVEWDDGVASVEEGICQLPFLTTDVAELRATVGRNDKCPCGSGRKFKKCFLMKQPRRQERLPL